MHLFDRVRYLLSPSLSQHRATELAHVLDNNGASPVDGGLDDATLTHFITNTHRFEGWRDLKLRDDLAVVTDTWVDRSMVLGKLQIPTYYSPDPAMIFSGVVACASELPPADLEVLSAGITALGGQWRLALTKDVTHLFCITPTSPKYATALHYQPHTHVRILLPHWFDDAVRLGTGALETVPYEWPDPPLLTNIRSTDPQAEKDRHESLKKAALKKVDPEKRSLYLTASLLEPDAPLPTPPDPADSQNVWQGRRILLGRSLELSAGRQEAIEAGIRRAGGLIVPFTPSYVSPPPPPPSDSTPTDQPPPRPALTPSYIKSLKANDKKTELALLPTCDVFITRFRSGPSYALALRLHKTIGTLPWVFHLNSSGVFASPLDQLLWYPVPRRGIDGFTGHEITLTNYTGESREYLKKLITLMGATFTPSMSGKNTVLIAAYISGTKTTKAATWSIPIVNHVWLEDCFVKWRNLTVALDKYISFPPGVDFSGMLGQRGVGRGVEDLSEEELEALEKEESEDELPVKKSGEEEEVEVKKLVQNGTQNSARDAREVEAIVSGGRNGEVEQRPSAMDVDHHQPTSPAPSPPPPPTLTLTQRTLAERMRAHDEGREKAESAARTRVKLRKKAGVSRKDDEDEDGDEDGDEEEHHPSPGKVDKAKTNKGRGNTEGALTGEHTDSEIEIISSPPKLTPARKTRLVRQAGEDEHSWIQEGSSVKKKRGVAGDEYVSPGKRGRLGGDETDGFPVKKRGRALKRRDTALEDEDKEGEDDASDGEEEDRVVEVPQRKRGAQPKKREQEPEVAAPQKRGKPPGRRKLSRGRGEDSHGEKEPEVEAEAEAEETFKVGPPRRRGQPPKTKVVAEQEGSDREGDEEEDVVETSIRKSGRPPRKVKAVVEEVVVGKRKVSGSGSKSKAPAKKSARNLFVDDEAVGKDENEEGEDKFSPKTKPKAKAPEVTAKSKLRGRGKARDGSEDEGESEVEVEVKKAKPKASTSRANAVEKKKKPMVVISKPVASPKTAVHEDVDEDEDEDATPPALEILSQRLSAVKKPVAQEEEEDDDEDEDEEKVTSKPKPKTKKTATSTVTTTTLKRTVSVLLPQMTLGKKASPLKEGGVTRQESMRAAADERVRPTATPLVPIASGSKSKAKAKFASSPPPPPPPEPSSSTARRRQAPADVSISSPLTPLNDAGGSTGKGRSKRTAAVQASQKLRDKIMPDVMSYQTEMKNDARRKSLGLGPVMSPVVSVGVRKKREKAEEEEEEGEEEGRESKKRRVEGKKVNWTDEDGEESEVGEIKVQRKGKRKVEEDDEEENKVISKGKKGVKAGEKDTSTSSVKPSAVRLMTTQVTLSEDVVKALTKLGVKMTTKPAECTHLLVPHLVRTEKFLCALAVAPFILTGKWATDSAAAKRLLDETNYLLTDKTNERKYNFVLADALAKAKELKGTLFAKKIFYVTPKVPIDIKLLKNVVTAYGGQVTSQIPTVRILNANADRHVISCPDDISIWRPIAKSQHPVYTQELILTGALKQEIDWEGREFRVPGSVDDLEGV